MIDDLSNVKNYNFEELRDKALKYNASFEDKYRLMKWCDWHDFNSWNGEVYDIGGGLTLRPIYTPVGDPDEDGDFEEWEITDIEIR